jgi:hypothetical protein
MARGEKSEIRIRLENTALIVFGAVLVVSMIVLYRGGIAWFSDIPWSKVTVLKWVAIGLVSAVGLVLQYYLLLLLRYSILRHLLWLLPVIWLVHNGLIVIQRFIEGEYHQALTGWIPITDLVGWFLSALYLPLLVAGGAVTAIADSAGYTLSAACQYAHATLNVAGISGWDMITHLGKVFDVFRHLVSDSFIQQISSKYAESRPFMDFGPEGLFRVPHWLFNIGYAFVCIIV